MSRLSLDAREKRINTADGNGIIERWAWGRALLADPTMVNEAGTLRRGRAVAERLIARAKLQGLALSEAEIKYRLQCARAYPTKELIASIAGVYGSWRALCDANFPPVQGAADQSVADANAPADDSVQPALDGDTGDVFPALVPVGATGRRPLGVCTLAQLEAYADEMERMTAGFVRRDDQRRGRLAKLLASVDGDREATYAAAIAAELEASA